MLLLLSHAETGHGGREAAWLAAHLRREGCSGGFELDLVGRGVTDIAIVVWE